MRKVMPLLLSLLLLLSSLPAAGAEDYRGEVLEYLSKKLQVSEEEITLEGVLQELPHTGEVFWVGRYFAGEYAGSGANHSKEEETASASYEGKGEVPHTGMDMPPAPDEPVFSVAAGVVYLRIATGEILTGEEAQPYLEAEWQLEREEWLRLEQEAGKIEVGLYRQLKQASPGTAFRVTIWPHYVETEAMRKAIQELYDKYPEYAGGRLPLPGNGAAPADGGREVSILPMPVAPPVDERGIAEDLPLEAPSTDVDPERYEEMRQKLQQIQLQGYAGSLAKLEAELNAMGIEYELEDYGYGAPAVQCSLTVEQALSLQDKEYIGSIGSEAVAADLYAAESARLQAAPPAAAGPGEADLGNRESSGSGNPYQYLLLLPALAILGGGAAFLARKKKAAGSEKR